MEETQNMTEGKSSGGNLKLMIILGTLVAIIGVVIWQEWYKLVSVERFALTLATNREYLQTFVETNYIAALLVYMGIYIIAVALSFPGATVITLAGGLLFNWHVGGTATIFAATIGATLIFFIAKTAIGEQLAKKAGPLVNRMREGFQNDAFNYMLFLRLFPGFPFWLVNIAPALLGVKLRVFFFGTLIGIIPGTFAFSVAGAGIDSVLEAQLGEYQKCLSTGSADCVFNFSLSGLLTPTMIAAFALLGVVSLMPVLLKKLRKAD